MKQRPGGFPTIKRPAPPPAVAAVEAKPAAVQQLQPPRTGFPRLPVRRVPPASAVVNDAPHATKRPAPPPLPVGEFFAAGDQDAGMDDPDSAGSGEAFPEPLFEDDDAPIITAPLPPPPRPEPTVLHTTPESRAAPPPVRLPATGLLASNVGPQPSNRPSFLPPARPRDYIYPTPPLPTPPSQAAPPPVRQPGGLSPSSGGAQPRALPKFLPPPGAMPASPLAPALRQARQAPLDYRTKPPNPPVRKQPGPQPIDPDDIPFDL